MTLPPNRCGCSNWEVLGGEQGHQGCWSTAGWGLRLLTARDKDSGAWRQALPITSVGLRMDDDTLRTAVGLRLGTVICAPHNCQLCGTQVSRFCTHGLSCRYSEGRHHRHAAINDSTLSSAGIQARLEPPGLLRSDGKRPDGMTLVPWTSDRPLVWDATCSDTFAESYTGARPPVEQAVWRP